MRALLPKFRAFLRPPFGPYRATRPVRPVRPAPLRLEPTSPHHTPFCAIAALHLQHHHHDEVPQRRAMASFSVLPRLALFEAIHRHAPTNLAIVHSQTGSRFTYADLLRDVADAAHRLRALTQHESLILGGHRIAFFAQNNYDYVVTFLSILACNCVALPLAPSFPASELRYILNHSEASVLLYSDRFKTNVEDVCREGLEKRPLLGHLEERNGGSSGGAPSLEDLESARGGLMLYTSGTTNRPKGVILSVSALTAQAQSLIDAWQYGPSDHLLHVLPLHHIHGTVNAVITPLLAGSAIEFQFPFNATSVWERLAAPFLAENGAQHKKPPITFFTVVPTIYHRLLSSFLSLPEPVQKAAKTAISPENLRLNISGSAALPTPTKSAWAELSNGNVLLERYGMTEVGMALSCGLSFQDRVDGSVGWALPSVQVRLVDTENDEVIAIGDETDASGREREGEIQLRGPTVFREYWQDPSATAKEFVDADDGKGPWFKTGDIAVRRNIEGAGKSDQSWARGPMYFIRGRKSVDIIKTGGEKVSALEVERELLSLPHISEAAVVGLPSEQWGQKVAAIVVLASASPSGKAGTGKKWSVLDMRRDLKTRLVNYKIPQELKVLPDTLPKNAMGKGLLKEQSKF